MRHNEVDGPVLDSEILGVLLEMIGLIGQKVNVTPQEMVFYLVAAIDEIAKSSGGSAQMFVVGEDDVQ